MRTEANIAGNVPLKSTDGVPSVAPEYFTLVFKGNLRAFKGNPLRTETPFGVPFICAIGNVCDEADDLRERLETLTQYDIEDPRP